MRVKSLGITPGLVNARPPGRAKVANAAPPPPGTATAGKCHAVAGGVGGGAVGAAGIDGCIITRKDLT